MPVEVKLPRLGQGMDEGKILNWLKAEGDKVAKGDELYEVETEKVNMEVEAPAAGTLLKIVVGPGEQVPIGTVIAWLGEPGEAVPDAPSANGAAPAAAPSQTPAAPAPTTPAPAAVTTAAAPAPAGDSRLKASPLARRMASEQGIDLAVVHGSGPEGRIIARDLKDVAAAAPAAIAQGGERIELSSMRRTIARRLSEAWQAPAFYLTIDVDMGEAAAMRKRLLKTISEGDVRPTVSDIITRACAIALRREPDMNVHWAGDAIIRFGEAHIGMAVATDNGLVVPVIRDAHLKTVREIAGDRADIVKRARSNKLSPADMEGGTFTISNLGMMGIDEFSAVLNPPMAGILAVGATTDRVVAVNGRAVVRPTMTVTLTCDHRAVDGAVGARFLAALKECLQEPVTMV
jgi:pyruvate dehydrogenase E2 component (dihydrolipoamide acetyltransferase)